MKRILLYGSALAALLFVAIFGQKWAGRFGDWPRPTIVSRPCVLVFKTDMPSDLPLLECDVDVRPVENADLDGYSRNRHKYHVPLPELVNYRTLARPVKAGEPILRSDFEDYYYVGFEPAPGMRALKLKLPSEQVGGVGKHDFVDAMLTTQACSGDNCNRPVPISATIAFGLKVIAVRTDVAAEVGGKAGSTRTYVTLEANPFRAKLIEWAMPYGDVRLFPYKPNEYGRNREPYGPTNKDEERRILKIIEGHKVTNHDLADALGLPKPIKQTSTFLLTIPRKELVEVDERGYTFTRPPSPLFFPANQKYVDCPTCPGGKKLIAN